MLVASSICFFIYELKSYLGSSLSSSLSPDWMTDTSANSIYRKVFSFAHLCIYFNFKMLKIVLFQFSSSYGCQLKCQKISSPATAEYTNSHWESGHNFKNISLLLLRLERQIKLNLMYQTKEEKNNVFLFL